MNKIVIVDYGMGNLRSVANAFKQACPEADVIVSSKAEDIEAADRVVFPGQGAMPDCMKELEKLGLIDVIKKAAETKPFLGICLGLQMLYTLSEEGNTKGLDMLSGTVRKFPSQKVGHDGLMLKVPQMGWAKVTQTKDHPLWTAIADNSWFYFVHSYYVDPENDLDTAGVTEYGLTYCCAAVHKSIFAVQFHPEKSGSMGLQLLYNFSIWQPFSE